MEPDSPHGIKVAKDIEMTEGLAEDFFKSDFKVSDKFPALYEKMLADKEGKPGPKTKLTPERYMAIMKYVQAGAWVGHAANAVGIKDETLSKWVKWGMDNPDSIYGVFVDDLKRATADSAMRNVFIIQRAAQNDWKAAQWLLKVQAPDIYNIDNKCRMEITGADGGDIKVAVGSIIDSKTLEALLEFEKRVEETNRVIDMEEDDDGCYKLPEDIAKEVKEVHELGDSAKKISDDIKKKELKADPDDFDIGSLEQ